MRFITFAARNVEHGCSRSDQPLSIDVHLQYSSCLEWLVAWTIPWWLESAVIVTVPLARTLCGLTAAYWTVNVTCLNLAVHPLSIPCMALYFNEEAV